MITRVVNPSRTNAFQLFSAMSALSTCQMIASAYSASPDFKHLESPALCSRSPAKTTPTGLDSTTKPKNFHKGPSQLHHGTFASLSGTPTRETLNAQHASDMERREAIASGVSSWL